MFETIRRYTFIFYILFLGITLTFMVALNFTKDWIEVSINEEITLTPNITKLFGYNDTAADKISKLDMKKTFRFGLKTFCVETVYEQSGVTENSCKPISIFHRDLEEAALKDALKFQILASVFACFPILTTFALHFCQEGPVKKIVCYLSIALLVFSGISLASCCYMVVSTITKHSGIVRNNIMAHIGSAQIELDTIKKGSGFDIAVAAMFFLCLSLIFFAWNFNKKPPVQKQENQDYRLLVTE
eukprot:TCONS_00006435-protein